MEGEGEGWCTLVPWTVISTTMSRNRAKRSTGMQNNVQNTAIVADIRKHL